MKNIIVAGPNGSLGKVVVHHLQDSGLTVTLLTRNVEKTNHAFPGLAAIHANYESVDELTKQLRSVGQHDAMVILVSRDEVQSQINLVDATIAAGIPHVIPSSFGFETSDPAALKLPPVNNKMRMENFVKEKAREGSLTFTCIQTGAFFDWAMGLDILLNAKGGEDAPTMVFDDGDMLFSATIVDDIGKAVAAALLKAADVRNRSVNVHTAVISQNKLLSYAKQCAPYREFPVMHLDTAELERQAWDKWNAGERGPEVMRGFLARASFGNRIGKFEKTENELLGIKQWSDEEIKQFVASYTN